jgi:hypothetical protein
MVRLYRPTIPVEIKCRVILRQLGEMFIEHTLTAHKGKLGFLLLGCLNQFASTLACEVSDLRLDHDPPLGARDQIKTNNPKAPYAYRPDANDPEHLRYRPHGAQYVGSHDIKTRVRGDHGQFSDIVLIKRERRRQRKESEKKASILALAKKRPRHKWPKRPFPKRGKTQC